jgi:hypothetical protein
MRRQLKRLQTKEQTAVEGSSDDEETKVSNKFGFISDEESEEEEAEPEVEVKPQKPTEQAASKTVRKDSFEATLKEFQDVGVEAAEVAAEVKESVLKRELRHFDPDYELQTMGRDKRSVAGFEAAQRSKKREGRRTILTPNVQFPTTIDYCLTMEKLPGEE